MIKIKLLESIDKVWCPAGTVGQLWYEDEWYEKFMPDNPLPGFPWKDGIYINFIKYEKLNGNNHQSPKTNNNNNGPVNR